MIRLSAGVLLLALSSSAVALDPASTVDGSPHRVRMITVDSTVRLEVLDWGGSGRPLLFVGCYLSGHVFDEIPARRSREHRGIPRQARARDVTGGRAAPP